jgi:hypothetical protein
VGVKNKKTKGGMNEDIIKCKGIPKNKKETKGK